MNRALISNGEFSIYLLQMGLEQWKDSSSSEDTESTGTVRRRKNVTVNLFSRSVEIQSKVSPKAVTYEWKDKNDSRIHGITKCFSFAKAKKNVVEEFINQCIENKVYLVLPERAPKPNCMKNYPNIHFEGDSKELLSAVSEPVLHYNEEKKEHLTRVVSEPEIIEINDLPESFNVHKLESLSRITSAPIITIRKKGDNKQNSLQSTCPTTNNPKIEIPDNCPTVVLFFFTYLNWIPVSIFCNFFTNSVCSRLGISKNKTSGSISFALICTLFRGSAISLPIVTFLAILIGVGYYCGTLTLLFSSITFIVLVVILFLSSLIFSFVYLHNVK